jgi:hypothetical protein
VEGFVARLTKQRPERGVFHSVVHRAKILALFMYCAAQMPNVAELICASTFASKNGQLRPEFDRFAALPRHEAELRVGKSLAAVLRGLLLPGECHREI